MKMALEKLEKYRKRQARTIDQLANRPSKIRSQIVQMNKTDRKQKEQNCERIRQMMGQ